MGGWYVVVGTPEDLTRIYLEPHSLLQSLTFYYNAGHLQQAEIVRVKLVAGGVRRWTRKPNITHGKVREVGVARSSHVLQLGSSLPNQVKNVPARERG